MAAGFEWLLWKKKRKKSSLFRRVQQEGIPVERQPPAFRQTALHSVQVRMMSQRRGRGAGYLYNTVQVEQV